MIAESTLAWFLLASLVMLITPGPTVLFIVMRSVSRGRRDALISILGIACANLLYVAATAAGIAAVVASSAWLFKIIKTAGAAYLVGLGLWTLLRASRAAAQALEAPTGASKLLAQGFIVDLLNPKTAAFYVAFLPQFVVPAAGPIAPQILVLGAIFIVLGIVTDALYALGAGLVASRLRRSRSTQLIANRFAGFTYVALGVIAFLMEPPAADNDSGGAP